VNVVKGLADDDEAVRASLECVTVTAPHSSTHCFTVAPPSNVHVLDVVALCLCLCPSRMNRITCELGQTRWPLGSARQTG